MLTGVLFDAVQIPVEAIHSQTGSADRDAVEAVFRSAAIDSAVIVYGWYYALVPAGTARFWTVPCECLGLSHSIGVPAPHRADPPGAYWLLTPPAGAEDLCDPIGLARLITSAADPEDDLSPSHEHARAAARLHSREVESTGRVAPIINPTTKEHPMSGQHGGGSDEGGNTSDGSGPSTGK
ncbi:hypothetical protein [Streptomyces olivoreticuli]|uniref:hypothetical protein n=1 Tax=Streptomyces olivoreticuli TaxID=68246 RepID=UPI000E231FDA|nr:hypothetical protein [Streptomyces olivoreticuli]